MMPPTVMNAVSINTRNFCRRAACTIRWIIQFWWTPFSISLLLLELLSAKTAPSLCTLPNRTGETPVAPTVPKLALQRVCELEEQAAIPDNSIPSFQAAGNFCLSIYAFAQRDRAPGKLV